jgi:hypothetical protein
MKAWAWSIENPQDAMAAFLKHNPAVDRGQATEHFRIAIRHMLTDYAKKEGIGVMDPAKMKITVERVSEYFGVSGVAPEDIYTNQFAPKGIHPKETSF